MNPSTRQLKSPAFPSTANVKILHPQASQRRYAVRHQGASTQWNEGLHQRKLGSNLPIYGQIELWYFKITQQYLTKGGGSGALGKWWRREVVTKGVWRLREMVTKGVGSGDFGKWWPREVVTKGVWWPNEVVTKGVWGDFN